MFWPDASPYNEANSSASALWRLHPPVSVKLPIFRPRNYIRWATKAWLPRLCGCVGSFGDAAGSSSSISGDSTIAASLTVRHNTAHYLALSSWILQTSACVCIAYLRQCGFSKMITPAKDVMSYVELAFLAFFVSVCLSVCLLTSSRKNYWSDLH